MRSYSLFMLFTFIVHSSAALAKFEAHEWGTFTSLVGSNGKTQNGMYHEDEELPDFVHGFGVAIPQVTFPQPVPTPGPFDFPQNDDCPRFSKSCFSRQFFDNNVVSQKMETPVIYFYSDEQDSQEVEINVKFPNGIITDTYPAPVRTYPEFSDNPPLKNGDTTFKVRVQPTLYDKIPDVRSGNIYGHARQVQSNIVRSGSEVEKFIFYRGMGTFQPKFNILSNRGNLYLSNTKASLPQATFLVHVDESGHGQLMKVTQFSDRGRNNFGATVPDFLIRRLKEHRPHSIPPNIHQGAQASSVLVTALVSAGLKTDEAKAMVNTWEHGYLKVPGLRLLYILPRAEADQILPLTMTPAPTKLERVFVARIEVMLDTEEEKLVQLVANGQIKTAALGRFAEPMLYRLKEVYVEKEQLAGRQPEPAKLETFDAYIRFAQQGEGQPRN